MSLKRLTAKKILKANNYFNTEITSEEDKTPRDMHVTRWVKM